MKTLTSSALFLAFSLLLSAPSYSQYKYDIGLKISSFNRNAIQLEFRSALNSSFSLFTNVSYGGEVDAFGYFEDISGDTIVNQRMTSRILRTYTGQIGFTKNISTLPVDFFYYGAAIGVGYEDYEERDSEFITYFDENGQSIHLETGESVTNESTISETFGSGMFYGLYLNLGMNVPIGKRFSVNCEFNAIAYYSDVYASLGFAPRFSGGLMYSFGQVKK